jgi:hypothetical protein
VPGIGGFPGEAYVLIDPEVGVALCAASPLASTSAASADDKCQLTFFHESKHFGFGESKSMRGAKLVLTSLLSMLGTSSYPRLYIPSQLTGPTKSETSPATLFLSGVMHEIVLDGTYDGAIDFTSPSRLVVADPYVCMAKFAELSIATGKNLGPVFFQLKNM